jgi:hypothetical protein
MSMNHDITHCKGGSCKLKRTCYRYKAWLDFPRYHKETGSTLVSMTIPESCIDNNYKLYWHE